MEEGIKPGRTGQKSTSGEGRPKSYSSYQNISIDTKPIPFQIKKTFLSQLYVEEACIVSFATRYSRRTIPDASEQALPID